MADLTPREYEHHPIRTVWDEEKEEWYFSIVDVVIIFTESPIIPRAESIGISLNSA